MPITRRGRTSSVAAWPCGTGSASTDLHPTPRTPGKRIPPGASRRYGHTVPPAKRVEVTVGETTLSLSNLDKLMYPRAGFTKGHVIDYYTRIAPVLLPHLRARPLTLEALPERRPREVLLREALPGSSPGLGPHGRRLVGPQRGRHRLLPVRGPADARVARQPGRHRDAHAARAGAGHGGADADRVRSRSRAAGRRSSSARWWRSSCARRSSTWGCRRSPRPRAPRGCRSICRLNTPVTYEDTRAFSRGLAQLLERRDPKRVVSDMSKAKRAGKVFVDWSQNDRHKTTVNVYSLRAMERPTVSTPLTWDEVSDAASIRRGGRVHLGRGAGAGGLARRPVRGGADARAGAAALNQSVISGRQWSVSRRAGSVVGTELRQRVREPLRARRGGACARRPGRPRSGCPAWPRARLVRARPG